VGLTCARALTALAALALAAGCSSAPVEQQAAPAPTPPVEQQATPAPSPLVEQRGAPAPSVVETPAASPTPTPPPWLGTRVLPLAASGYGEVRATPRALRRRAFTLPDRLPALPGSGWAARVSDPAPARVLARSTWVPGCPVARDALAWVRLTFRGFDGARHTGELLVASSVADDVVTAFRGLWRARFPIEQMHVTSAAELDLPPTGDGNNTGAFVCRPVRGAAGDGQQFSQHAYGTALDVDPFQNPYTRSDGSSTTVLPELASAYLDRGDVRPGMLLPDGPAVRAFAAIGWTWGGTYRSFKDYQHLSLTGG
jgi:hypothetical protein